MKSEMAKKLKELLDNMSQEDFDQKWAAVEALELKGPSADEVFEYYSINYNTTVQYSIEQVENSSTGLVGEPNYALAA